MIEKIQEEAPEGMDRNSDEDEELFIGLIRNLYDFLKENKIESHHEFEVFFSATLHFLGVGIYSLNGQVPPAEHLHKLMTEGYTDGLRADRLRHQMIDEVLKNIQKNGGNVPEGFDLEKMALENLLTTMNEQDAEEPPVVQKPRFDPSVN